MRAAASLPHARPCDAKQTHSPTHSALGRAPNKEASIYMYKAEAIERMKEQERNRAERHCKVGRVLPKIDDRGIPKSIWRDPHGLHQFTIGVTPVRGWAGA